MTVLCHRRFEGPYGAELLASTHWVATREGAMEPAAAAASESDKRKGRIYSDDRIGAAPRPHSYDRLKATGSSL